MRTPTLTIGRKLILASALAFCVFALVLLALWYAGEQANQRLLEQSRASIAEGARRDLARRGELTLDFLAQRIPNLLYYVDLKGLYDTLSPVLADPDVQYLIVYDRDGRVVHDGHALIGGFGQPMTDALATKVIGSAGLQVHWTPELVDISRPVMLGSERIGGIRVGLSRASSDAWVAAQQEALAVQLDQRFSAQMHALVLAFSVVLVAVLLIAWLIRRDLVQPVLALATASERLGRGDYHAAPLDTERSDEVGALMRSFGRMTRALEQHDQEIRRIAYEDALTGLPNRLFFRDLLDQVIDDADRGHGRVGLLFVDLDGFKRINDTLGHDAGDQVLIQVARRLREVSGRQDAGAGSDRTVVARLGGDEFVALVSGDEVTDRCLRLGRSIIETLDQPFAIGGKQLTLGSSVGIAVYPDDAQTARDLLHCGDLAMYQAKRRGRNQVCRYDARLAEAADWRCDIEETLRKALAECALEVLYQPIYDLDSGQLSSVEALVRLPGLEGVETRTEQVIEVAESCGLINQLGHQVLLRACRDAAAWQDRLPGVRVAVNLSGRQLADLDFGVQLFQVLADTGLSGRVLSLELTESSLLNDSALDQDLLERLNARGIELWLDDFGTGYSRLAHLRQLRVSGVKIDRSFISEVHLNADDQALSAAVIAMAHSIGMRVIAEGVELVAQYEWLKRHHCDYVQGFLTGRPVPADQLSGEALALFGR